MQRIGTRLFTFSLGIAALVAILLIGVSQLRGGTQPAYSADVIGALRSGDSTGFARAMTVREFTFPQDFGAHPDYQTEWWYYTGNLATAEGRRFGYQLTIFRRALTATATQRESSYGTNQIYFAHFAVSDIQGGRFYDADRYSRGGGGLAGALVDVNANPSVRVWIEDWTMDALTPDAGTMRLRAAHENFAIDFTVKQLKPPTLQGDRGLSAKSAEPGNASYYYSLSRLATEGTITIDRQRYTVTGYSWKDHEYSTSVLSENAIGWDWFSLQLDDNRELMLYRIRRNDGTFEPTSDGTLVYPDGTYERLKLEQYQIENLAQWTSPRSGATYPAKWKITVTPKTGDPLILTVEPLLAGQEIVGQGGTYWEGANRITGMQGNQPISGYGYVELTGYNQADKLPTR
jgi:predicted secreted hydrolase